MKKNITFLLLMFSVTCISMQGQEISRAVIASSGNYFENSTASISWTLGELAIETYSSSGNIITQGFQQPCYEVITASKDIDVDLGINIFPVPATDYVTVEMNNIEPGMVIKLYHLSGKCLLEMPVKSTSTSLHMNTLSPSEYILHICKDNNLISTYKITKY